MGGQLLDGKLLIEVGPKDGRVTNQLRLVILLSAANGDDKTGGASSPITPGRVLDITSRPMGSDNSVEARILSWQRMRPQKSPQVHLRVVSHAREAPIRYE